MPDRKRVLIVDDEESIRLLLRRILEADKALEISLAGGGGEALDLIAEHTYDLVLLDLLMPGTGGIEVLTRMRAMGANLKTPVIIVSILTDAPTRTVCESLGVQGYLAKPIDREGVIKAVNRVIAA
jgi:adenylate cyclase